jgi:hypothetical protein
MSHKVYSARIRGKCGGSQGENAHWCFQQKKLPFDLLLYNEDNV